MSMVGWFQRHITTRACNAMIRVGWREDEGTEMPYDEVDESAEG